MRQIVQKYRNLKLFTIQKDLPDFLFMFECTVRRFEYHFPQNFSIFFQFVKFKTIKLYTYPIQEQYRMNMM